MTATREITILTNSFHNSEYRSTKSRDELDAIDAKTPWHRTDAEKALVRRIEKALCGIEGCTCGRNSFGER